jgi:hypothetical protein
MMTISIITDDVKVNASLASRSELNAFEEVADTHPQSASEAGDVVERWIPETELDPAKVGTMNADLCGERLLGEAAPIA